ncbi:putative ABC transport system ATP-binding protein [Cohaesibacter marisflavi]|uniref:Putative ABC transport system ATP-binding protein n=1 Tax=Cohaesibacter marisflavi TaxID=655353 RepID=A0A1I5HWW8_9HYPH|nr:ABC transporter ATP-binding protein [Cohaesibacter marisflavi]SFO52787.1 putative ABC transport system ATP-binding protein [Cohaesibacter marisflavi]
MNSLELSVQDLLVSGERGRTLLTVEQLVVHPGETVGIRGPSGAGKSTMLYALAGLANVAQGQVRWGDAELSTMGEEARARFRRSSVGMVFQDFLLFEELDAVSNAAIATGYLHGSRHAALLERAQSTLQKLNVKDLTQRTIASFSGGERQRVAIARALAHDPAVILADEPTASLDRKVADQLIDDLVALVRQEKKTLIAVSHDHHLHERMDRIIDIEDGRMVGEVRND